MAVTGYELGRRLANKVGQPYTTFSDGVKTNRLFSDALLWAIKDRSKKLGTERTYPSEISFVIVTGQVVSLTNNQFFLASLQISFIFFGATTATITTVLPHNLNTGENVTLSLVQGAIVPTINNTFPVTVLTPTTFTIPFTWTSGAYTPETGIVSTANTVSNYWDVLAIKAKFSQQLYSLTVTGASNTTPIVMTVAQRNNLRDGEQIPISAVTGNTAANGTYYIKTKGAYSFYLYQDKNFQTPVAGNGPYTGGGILQRTYYNYCKPYESDTKISSLNTPTIQKPRYEQAQRMMKIYPLTEVCQEATMDFIIQPPIPIDVTDNVTDMTLYFPEEFLDNVVDRAGFEFANPSRDMELRKLMTQQIQVNP